MLNKTNYPKFDRAVVELCSVSLNGHLMYIGTVDREENDYGNYRVCCSGVFSVLGRKVQ